MRAPAQQPRAAGAARGPATAPRAPALRGATWRGACRVATQVDAVEAPRPADPVEAPKPASDPELAAKRSAFKIMTFSAQPYVNK
jgi:hypothetical protein